MAGLETSKEFAARMKNNFVLKGPRSPAERKEGGSEVQNTDSSLSFEPDTSLTTDSTPDNTQNIVPDLAADDSVVTPANTSLLSIASQSMQGIDLLTELHEKYHLDSAYQAILAKPSDFRNFEVKNQVVYLKKPEKRILCIPKVLIQGRSAREIVISEAHSMLAHLGASKTLDYLRDHVWWKDMVSDV
jgi:hypothetical protein